MMNGAELSVADKLIMGMLYQLFWLVTQAPGVARYASDVRQFVEVAKLLTDDPEKIASLERLAVGYEKEGV